ncbi:MAG: PIN domain-containing protein [Candidatus Levybacteria bacterium]|nr:PIN domain-containing protein [Candidatus Levybacteria bacterium]
MLIDTNILVYSINLDSLKYKQAKEFINNNLGRLEIAHQNILEAIRVLTHKKFSNPRKLKEALSSTLSIAQSCSLISPNQNTLYLALELIKKHNLSGNRIFDAYLTATALSNGITSIATDNTRDFKKFNGIKTINPFASTIRN